LAEKIDQLQDKSDQAEDNVKEQYKETITNLKNKQSRASEKIKEI